MLKRVLEGATKEARAAARQRIGTLRQLTVQPNTRTRYTKAVDKFLAFLKSEGLVLPRSRDSLDGLVCEFLEHLWITGESRAVASDCLAGLQDYDPKLRGHLQGSWRLLKAWNANELPSRAPPLPEHVLHAMIGFAFFKEWWHFGISLLIGYYSMLRTGEILTLDASRFSTTSSQTKVVIALGLTKSGKRAGAAESVVLAHDFVVALVKHWLQKAPPRCPLTPSPGAWHAQFIMSV